jgi:hypothetical protein
MRRRCSPPRRLAAAWLGLGITRSPWPERVRDPAGGGPHAWAVRSLFPTLDFFRTARVVHVDQSVLIWFLAPLRRCGRHLGASGDDSRELALVERRDPAARIPARSARVLVARTGGRACGEIENRDHHTARGCNIRGRITALWQACQTRFRFTIATTETTINILFKVPLLIEYRVLSLFRACTTWQRTMARPTRPTS